MSLEKECASVCHDPLLVTVTQLQEAIEALPPGSFKAHPRDASGAFSPTPASSTPVISPPPGVTPAPQPCFIQPLVVATQIHIEGMTCNSCAQSIEGMISQRKGVRSAQVSLANHCGTFEYDPLLTTLEELREAIEDMGFDAFLPGENRARSTSVTAPQSPQQRPLSSPSLSTRR